MGRDLDSADQAILNALSEDARMPLATLAKEVNLSRNALRNRLERLERDNVISKYTIMRGDGKPQREKTIALIMIVRRDRMRGADVTTALKKIPEVRACYVMSGKLDLVAHVEVDRNERLNDICAEIWDMPGVIDTRTNIVLSTVVDRK